MIFNSPYEIEFPEDYGVCDNRLGYFIVKKNDERFVEMCNFVPYISSQTKIFDGYETHTKAKISGFDSNGNPLPEITVSNEDFDKMLWARQYVNFVFILGNVKNRRRENA